VRTLSNAYRPAVNTALQVTVISALSVEIFETEMPEAVEPDATPTEETVIAETAEVL